MCTSIFTQSQQAEYFLGRTMDFSYPIDPAIYVIPNNYKWHNPITMKQYVDRYRFIGIGQEIDGLLGFFDGVNEHGFAAAALYFPGYADYTLSTKGKKTVDSLDFLHFLLGNCSCLEELLTMLEDVCITGLADPITKTAAPLHWIASDNNGKCVVIEQTEEGLAVFDNPIGVMANSPDFEWHITNLSNYINTSVHQKSKAIWSELLMTPFGQGGGTMPLPGGYTSPERFVRTAFIKSHMPQPQNRTEAIMSGFHALSSVFVPKGIVITDRNTMDYTKYTAMINTSTGQYYFRTYEQNQIATVGIWDCGVALTRPVCLGSLSRMNNFNGNA